PLESRPSHKTAPPRRPGRLRGAGYKGPNENWGRGARLGPTRDAQGMASWGGAGSGGRDRRRVRRRRRRRRDFAVAGRRREAEVRRFGHLRPRGAHPQLLSPQRAVGGLGDRPPPPPTRTPDRRPPGPGSTPAPG